MRETVQNTINGAREKAKLTQEDLAKRAGVTRQTIIAMEGGNYTPSVLLALRLSKIFKTPVEKLFWI